MLGRLILTLLQIAIAWFATPVLAGYVPVPGKFSLFLYAVICAIVVFIVGLVAAQVLKDVGQPSSTTLTWSLVGALIGAALITFGPQYIHINWNIAPPRTYALAGAIIGYVLKR